MKTYDIKSGERINTPKEMIDFFKDIEVVCNKHGFSIDHQDGHGAFIISSYSDRKMNWLKQANKNY